MDVRVMEYKCPCCNAGLQFGDKTQQLTCEYCGNAFEIDTVKAFNEAEAMKTEEMCLLFTAFLKAAAEYRKKQEEK